MKQLIQAALAVLLVVLASCGGSPADKAGAAMDDLNSALAGITDVDSAKAAVPAMEKAIKALKAAGKAGAKDGKDAKEPSAEELKEMTARGTKMGTELTRLAMIEGVSAVIDPVMNTMGK